MAFSFGFYNSYNHDRVYNTSQISRIFDGIIRDGIYATIGEQMIVKKSDNQNTVIVSSGRAWFDHTWNYNDSDYILESEPSELILDRIDAVVLDINSNDDYRENKIKWVKGTPSSNPIRPTLLKSSDHNQYPLAYVYRTANVETINQEDITNMVGTSECPFVTSVLESVSIDNLLLQWKDQWEQFLSNYEESATDWFEAKKAFFDSWFEDVQNFLTSAENGELLEEVMNIYNQQIFPVIDLIGDTDISGIADGTLTGAVDKLNSDLGGFSFYPEKLTQAQYDALPSETKGVAGLIFVIVKE